MREIKFRGLARTGKWAFGDLIHGVGIEKGETFILPHVTNLAYAGVPCDPLNGCRVPAETVGQFTGLHDKNTVEVYEGDLFSTPAFDGPYPIEFNVLGHVCIVNETGQCSLLTMDVERGEVVGNIHQNPELLEAK